MFLVLNKVFKIKKGNTRYWCFYFIDEQNTINTVNNIIDGDDGNRWSASGYSQFVVVDLGQEYSVDEIKLETYQDRDYQFTIEGSTSSATSGFITLVNASNNVSSGPI